MRSLLGVAGFVGLVGAVMVTGVGCGDRSPEETCADIEQRLAAEVDALPLACRRPEVGDSAGDCRSIQLHCGVFTSTSATEVPTSIVRLAERFETLQCCHAGFQSAEPVEGAVPPAICDGDEPGNRRCKAIGPTCLQACARLTACGSETDPIGWRDHPDGCGNACEAGSEGLSTLRRIQCVVEVECEGLSGC